MGRKLLTSLIVLAVLAFGAAYFGSPVLAVRSLVKAAEAGDAAALERKVDFPALRSSLKSEMSGVMRDELRDKAGDLGSGLGGLGMILAPSFMDSAVDALVTPRVVAEVVRTGQRPQAGDAVRGSDPEPKASDSRLHRAYGYRDLNTFVIRLTREDRPEQPLRLLMTRHGLFDWKLSGVEFPPPSR